jgi:hypothetical protein
VAKLKLASSALLAAALIAMVVLLLAPIYVEPGNGSISCGRVWAPSAMEDFLADDCGDVIAIRRIQLEVAAAVAVISGGGVIFNRRFGATR